MYNSRTGGEFTIKDLDIFFVSYDELNADVNWENLLSLHGSAKRIHGVTGFDKAYKICAKSSTTQRFVIVDGDNWANPDVFDYQLNDLDFEDVCYSFKSRNVINGLEYGNGGIKVWDKTTLLASNTHEKSNSTDFCWNIRYYQLDHVASTTVQNGTPYQAWRSGYREGIKMTQVKGKPCDDFANSWKDMFSYNISRLHIWCSVGRDVENGIWAILGARQAILDVMQRTIKHTSINDYGWFEEKWKSVMSSDPDMVATSIRHTLETIYDFYIPELNDTQSEWFKRVYINPPRSGLML